MTSKEALEKICSKCEEARAKQRIRCPFRSISNDYCEEYKTIEKSLKMLEIIKHKEVNIWQFIRCIKDRKEHHKEISKIKEFNFYDYSLNWEAFKPTFISTEKLTEEEFNLIKEWLEDDKSKHKDFDAYGQQQCEGDCGC